MRIQRRLIHSDVQPSTSFEFDPIHAFFPPLARRFTETFAPIIRHTSVQMNECFRVWNGIKACDVMWVCVCLCQTSAYHFWACQLTVNIHSKYFEHKIFPLKRKTVIIDLLTPFTRWHINQLNINFQQLMSSHLNECNIIVILSRKCCRWILAQSNLWLSLCVFISVIQGDHFHSLNIQLNHQILNVTIFRWVNIFFRPLETKVVMARVSNLILVLCVERSSNIYSFSQFRNIPFCVWRFRKF